MPRHCRRRHDTVIIAFADLRLRRWRAAPPDAPETLRRDMAKAARRAARR